MIRGCGARLFFFFFLWHLNLAFELVIFLYSDLGLRKYIFAHVAAPHLHLCQFRFDVCVLLLLILRLPKLLYVQMSVFFL